MKESTVYLDKESTPYKIDELAKRILAEGKVIAGKLFKEFKEQIAYELAQTHKNSQAKSEKVANEIDLLNLNIKELTVLRSLPLLKQRIIDSINLILDPGNRILFKHQYEIQVTNTANSFLTLKKKKYLENLYEEWDEKPEKGEKIKFLGTPSQFAYMINVLIDKGFIENANTRNNGKSLRKIARILYDSIYISDSTGTGETSFENFYKEFRINSLSPAGRDWIVIRKFK